MAGPSQVYSIYTVYQIIKKLTTPFEQTDAFKLGIIDKNGNVLRKRRTLKTQQEKEAYTVLDTLVFNIKKLLKRFGGDSKLSSYVAALWLLKEEKRWSYFETKEEQMIDLIEAELKETKEIINENKQLLDKMWDRVHDPLSRNKIVSFTDYTKFIKD
jgi:hypothetical protein